ncbi:MAG: CoA transferase [Sandaracinaceae bacterium]|nr:CoA transferase [Sandaracinaceae bacterium]MBK7776188.1 CoA transferase [Sandaracinaceae bacterium]MBK8407734.1 CoA transferase [Sandaracinaceae bacterium]MBK8588481.1 CoA transferase [Sandaracinaceae bacterium]
MPNPHPLAGALDDVRVLDLTQNLPGPYATVLLAALGATVIKVEPPGGETARGVPSLFELVNRGKQSVVLDLKTERGREALLALAAECDVLVEGFRPGVLESLGIAPAVLHARNPRLVICRISGFGQTGPYAEHPAHDLNLQALTGVCHLSRDREGHPLGSALPIADLSAGGTAATTILAALRKRERTGSGMVLDVALSDTVQSWAHIWDQGLTPPTPSADRAVTRAMTRLGEPYRARGIGHAIDRAAASLRRSAPVQTLERLKLHSLPHYGTYRTRDGRWLAVGIVDEGKFWRALCEALELPRLGKLPVAARVLLGNVVRRQLAGAFERRTLEDWMSRLPRHEVPVTPVLDVNQAARDPHLLTRLGPGMNAPVVPYSLAGALGPAPKLDEYDSRLVSFPLPRA